jgi:hypothetical protein
MAFGYGGCRCNLVGAQSVEIVDRSLRESSCPTRAAGMRSPIGPCPSRTKRPLPGVLETDPVAELLLTAADRPIGVDGELAGDAATRTRLEHEP